jgi:hypothetical protein
VTHVIIRAEIEEEIQKLESLAEASSLEKARLRELKTELEKIKKKKDEYVQEHPEQRKLVYRARKSQNEEEKKAGPSSEQKRNLFGKNGLPLRPERSIYYHPMINPFGVPPPGMPYIEKRASFFVYYFFHELNKSLLQRTSTAIETQKVRGSRIS